MLKSLVIKKGEKCEKTCLSGSVIERFAADDLVCVELQLRVCGQRSSRPSQIKMAPAPR